LLGSTSIMDTNSKQDAQGAVETRSAHAHIGAAELAAEALAGAAAGAAVGVLAGPPGMVAGAVIGGAIAAAAGAALHEEIAYHNAEDAQLDRDIGVFGGSIGEAPPDAPKAQRGVFHTASMGVGSGPSSTPSEGPMQNLDEE
jgi:phage tail tape-measure protein